MAARNLALFFLPLRQIRRGGSPFDLAQGRERKPNRRTAPGIACLEVRSI
jgi:hypothetical protein